LVRAQQVGRDAGAAWLSIGALSRTTGVAVETLRTWESRYGFPVPERKPSGHRVYPLSAVPRLRRIAQALALGHRAGQVVGASEGALGQLLAAAPAGQAPRAAAAGAPASVSTLLELVARFDAEQLRRELVADWARLGPVEFLESRVAPLVHAVGEAWATGDLDIRHEHFLSDRVSGLLSSLRQPFEERANGPLVVYATLPGELHGLGLQMSALVLTTAGCRALYLGTDVPVPQLVSLVRDLAARVVAVSVSRSSRGQAPALLRRLREALPQRARLVVGGEGAPTARPGIEVVTNLRALDVWGRRLALGLPPAAA
jgi:MerR family transcriptional regulator, light-induced transcriptional regulator